ncbi:DUF4148 domain-containing protein [Roseateles chitosanitabidus]|jgi:hypothetical protein|uniref:DUF4148 domain-containing protein n=1 Tax=Roseateles chitosanitabidus TaxID=65048 RepID=UPI000836536E|nr:DUF4148 domain-containing protein [Roseateles chitosanitabidus]MBO9688256.1 DUF4148 domain-containing protein [Roseateles chitosanitabidus]
MRHFHRLSIATGVVALAATLSGPVLAQVEEEVVSGPKSRDQVVAELEQARADGSLAKIQSEQGYSPDFDEARGMPVQYSNHQAESDISVSADMANPNGDLRFAAPAAGGKSRAQVMDELQQAREDGTLDRMWSESGYAPELEATHTSRP